MSADAHGSMGTPSPPPPATGNAAAPGPSVDPTSALPTKLDVPAWRMFGTLGVAGAIAGLLIVLVFGWAQPRIEAHQAEVLRSAVQEVLRGPARYDTLYVDGDRLSATPPAGLPEAAAARVYLGYDADGAPIGFAIATAKAGFQDNIRLIFGFDAGAGTLLGMKVLESKETPGLGDKIEKDSSFVGEFRGVAAPLIGVKSGAGRDGANEVDMITGATISSRTIIDAINAALERLRPTLEAYVAGGAR